MARLDARIEAATVPRDTSYSYKQERKREQELGSFTSLETRSLYNIELCIYIYIYIEFIHEFRENFPSP